MPAVHMSNVAFHLSQEFPAAPEKPRPPFRLRSVALPNEHGSWGILFEPLVCGIIVAPSPAAAFILLLYVGAFLSRQPLKIYLADLKAKRSRPQTTAATAFAFGYLSIAVLGLFGTLGFAGFYALLPLIVTTPLALIQLGYDMQGKSRRVLPEMAAIITLASSAAVFALAAGWTPATSIALSSIFVLRLIPSILYVRERIKLDKGKPSSFAVPLGAHILALAGTAILAWYSLIPWLPATIFAFLLVRALTGSSNFRLRIRAMQIGMLETAYGCLVVLSVILGRYLHL
jgi:hypothetical protein